MGRIANTGSVNGQSGVPLLRSIVDSGVHVTIVPILNGSGVSIAFWNGKPKRYVDE